MRLLKKIFFLLLIIIAGWWLLGKLNIVPSLGSLFSPKPVVIDETTALILEIKRLAQLVTVSAYNEIVVDSTVIVASKQRAVQPLVPFVLPPSIYINKAIVIIGKTITHVGIDMDKLKPEHMRITNDSIYLSLPKAQILDVILNPSDVEIFIEKGTWNNESIAVLKRQVSAVAVKHTVQKGLLAESEKKAVEIMTRFFVASGKKVIIDFK